jgi:hypothetical protein
VGIFHLGTKEPRYCFMSSPFLHYLDGVLVIGYVALSTRIVMNNCDGEY